MDMEWLYGASESSNMEVDIGYLPQVRGLSNMSYCMFFIYGLKILLHVTKTENEYQKRGLVMHTQNKLLKIYFTKLSWVIMLVGCKQCGFQNIPKIVSCLKDFVLVYIIKYTSQ